MDIESWPVDKPTPYARNARKLSSQAVDKVAASIHEFGFRQPIVVDEGGTVVAGHTRLLAAKKLGLAARGATRFRVWSEEVNCPTIEHVVG